MKYSSSACKHLRPGAFPKLVAFFIALLFCAKGMSQTPARFSDSVKRQVSALMQEKAARTPAQRKMDTQLIYGARQLRDGYIIRDAPQLRASLKVRADKRVKVDIDAVVSDELLAAIKAVGGTILGSFPDDHSIGAVVPLDKLNRWQRVEISASFSRRARPSRRPGAVARGIRRPCE